MTKLLCSAGTKLALCLTASVLLGALATPTYGQEVTEKSSAQVIQGATESEPVTPRVFDGDLRDLPKAKAWKRGDPIREVPRRVYPRSQKDEIQRPPASPHRDPLLELQESAPQGGEARAFSTPELNFAGTSFTGVVPPDTVGDVGPNHYIQMVNSSGGSVVAIYDKSGTLLAGPITLDTLAGGGNCAFGAGDPIVLYDLFADRWLMSEFSSVANALCVYISQTADPVSGGWFSYEFPTPFFPDYPKYAVWPDAYYVSTNEPSPAAYALDRTKMLSGLPATSQRFTAPPLAGFGFQALIPSDVDGFGFQALMPSDLDGAHPQPAPLGPNYFMRHRDDEVHNPGSNDPDQDFLEIWEFRVDFTNPANSSFTGPTNIAISEFDSDLCGLFSFFCFPQPGTTTTLDPLREVVMWRLQYRIFGTHETLVGNFVTDVDGTDHGGIRWFELRKIGAGPWTLFQEGTYAPDSAHRWMGSIAMDGDGNMALGYSVSSTSVFPSIRYTGRLAGDTAGVMTEAETTLIAGSGSQTFSTRWGDYSSMNVDPADDCTFWYTNEYVPASGLWETRIGSFKFPSCGPLDGQDDVIIDFGPELGLQVLLNNSEFVQLHAMSPESMVTGDMDGNGQDEVIVDFGPGEGLWVRLNNSTWVQLHAFSPESMVTGDIDGNGQDDVIIDAGPGFGLWVRMNDSSWVKLHDLSPETMVTGDMDGNGQDEVIVDLGPGMGLWVRMNDSTWVQLHSISPESMVTGDMDGNGKDDVIIDAGPSFGLWVRMNDSEWVKLHNLSPEGMVTGDIDGI